MDNLFKATIIFGVLVMFMSFSYGLINTPKELKGGVMVSIGEIEKEITALKNDTKHLIKITYEMQSDIWEIQDERENTREDNLFQMQSM